VFFDQSAPAKGDVRGVTGPAAQSRSPRTIRLGRAPEPPLEARFRDSLLLEDNGDPAQKNLLDKILTLLLKTRTGAELAEEFVKLGATARVGFARIPGSRILVEHGKSSVHGTLGRTFTRKKPALVELNILLLQTKAGRVEVAGVLAHELLGHVRAASGAEAGSVKGTLDFYDGDELGARLAGWNVALELGRMDPDALDYLKDPEGYSRSSPTADDSYALLFSRKELSDPVRVLKERLAAVAELRKPFSGWRETLLRVRLKHPPRPAPSGGKTARREAGIQEKIEFLEQTVPNYLRTWRKVAAALRMGIKYFGTPAGKRKLAALRKSAEDPFFAEMDRSVARLAQRLRANAGLSPAGGRAQASSRQGSVGD